MRILILGINYAPEPVGIAAYTAPMAEGLAARGHEVAVIAGPPSYPEWRVPSSFRSYGTHEDRGVAITRVPLYVPANPTGLRRLAHQASFALASLGPLLHRAIAWRPDIVMAIAPALLAAPVARFGAMIAGSRSWLHVQDFEADAASATGLLPRTGPVRSAVAQVERTILKSFSVVSTISPAMENRLLGIGVRSERIVSLRNWADPDVTPLAQSRYRAAWGLEGQHVMLYSGSLGRKQGLGIIIETARRLADRKDVTFVICGGGPERAALEAAGSGLVNLQFRDLQPRSNLKHLLALASVHLMPQSAGISDLVLPSKLANMLASGRPLIATAMPGSGLALELGGCGMTTPPGDAPALAAAVVRLVDDIGLRDQLARAAVRQAALRWHKGAILDALDANLRACAGVPQPASGLTST